MLTIRNKKVSSDGSIKYLFAYPDGALVEAIKFEYNNAQAICVSTQVGCGTGCKFCASADYHLKRNLTKEEICDEVKTVLEDNPNLEIFDVVAFQGTGEPLSNLSNVSKAAQLILDKKLAKDLSLATSGNLIMFPKIKDTPVKKVYLSLHATDDITRNMLIPTNVATGVKKLIAFAKKHVEDTKVPVTINYLLLDGINDTSQDLDNLIKLLNPNFFTIQLLILNSVKNSKNQCLKSSPKIEFFKTSLERAGFTVTVLRSKGADIEGGCGQMVSKYAEL